MTPAGGRGRSSRWSPLFPLILLLVSGCAGGHSDEVSPGLAVPDLHALEILPREGTTEVSLAAAVKTLELLLRGTYADGSQKMIDAIQAEWTPTEGTAGFISIHGLFTAAHKGTIEIEARLGRIKDRIVLTVRD